MNKDIKSFYPLSTYKGTTQQELIDFILLRENEAVINFADEICDWLLYSVEMKHRFSELTEHEYWRMWKKIRNGIIDRSKERE